MNNDDLIQAQNMFKEAMNGIKKEVPVWHSFFPIIAQFRNNGHTWEDITVNLNKSLYTRLEDYVSKNQLMKAYNASKKQDTSKA